MSDDFKGRGGSPWGAPPGGGGNGSGRGPTPPDIDAIIKDIQNKINNFYLVGVNQVESRLA
jgi:membrane protease subunit HflK